MIIYICTLEIFKTLVKTNFWVRNIHLYLCWQVEDTKWILCCRKTDVKCAYLRFLIYKVYFLIDIPYELPKALKKNNTF